MYPQPISSHSTLAETARPGFSPTLNPFAQAPLFEKACERVGMQRKGGSHSLRRSFATHLLEGGLKVRSSAVGA